MLRSIPDPAKAVKIVRPIIQTEFETSQTYNNSSSLINGYHNRMDVWISHVNKHRFFTILSLHFFFGLVSIENIYQP